SLLGTDLCANQACCALIPKGNAESFVFLLVSSAIGHYKQQTRGSAQQNLSQSIVGDLQSVIPPTVILEAFNEVTKPLLELCMQNLRECGILGKLRDTLLPKLMSGDVRVREAEEHMTGLG